MTIKVLLPLYWGAGIGLLFAVVLLRRWREAHHGYIGFVLGAPCIYFGWWIPAIIGLAVLTDDAYQHARQLKEPAYLSPLHRAYGWIYNRVAWVRALNRWADSLFA